MAIKQQRRGGPASTTTCFVVERSDLAMMRALAAREERTMGSLIREAIKDLLARRGVGAVAS